jgi:type IV pilus assembly protein PilA
MIVVAIIGILSAVALPNFKKYQAKSKTSEAKMQLAALYTAEYAFYADYGAYATCLTYMGFNPANEQAGRYYAVGFPSAAAPANAHNIAINNGALNAAEGCLITERHHFAAGKITSRTTVVASGATNVLANHPIGGETADPLDIAANPSVTSALGFDASVAVTCNAASSIGDHDPGNETFTACAAGAISGDYLLATTVSLISINENKQIIVVRNGF